MFEDELENPTAWNMGSVSETNDNIGRQVVKRF